MSSSLVLWNQKFEFHWDVANFNPCLVRRNYYPLSSPPTLKIIKINNGILFLLDDGCISPSMNPAASTPSRPSYISTPLRRVLSESPQQQNCSSLTPAPRDCFFGCFHHCVSSRSPWHLTCQGRRRKTRVYTTTIVVIAGGSEVGKRFWRNVSNYVVCCIETP